MPLESPAPDPLRGDLTEEQLADLYGADLVAEQLELETEMTALGSKQYIEKFVEAKEANLLTRTSEGRSMQDAGVHIVAAAIEKMLAEALAGKAGRKRKCLRFLQMLPPMEIAFITMQVVVDRICRIHQPFSPVAQAIAKCIQNEVNFRRMREEQDKVYKSLAGRLNKSRANYAYKAKLMTKAAKGFLIEQENWSHADREALGTALLEIVQVETGIIKRERVVQRSGKTKAIMYPTEKALEWIERAVAARSVLSPRLMPTVIPPRPWVSITSGGYWSDRVSDIHFIKSRNRNYLKEMEAVDLEVVFAGANALQETPWRINSAVLEVMEAVWEKRLEIGVVPSGAKLPYPPRPGGIRHGVPKAEMEPEERDRFNQWQADKRAVFDENQANKTRRVLFGRTLSMAIKFRHRDAFYFPHTIDFRNRFYSVPAFLDPQGSDGSRGLLEFANAVPVTDEEGARWLAIHGANCYGNDKVGFDERVAWAHENTERITRAAEDPLGDYWWAEADKPWQFLAWCFEWAGYIREGYDWLSSIPVQMDGSCNGLQHFSALLRDAIGGQAVNLVPGEEPRDIYGQVAELVKQAVWKDARTDAVARGWLGKVDRKVVKRPVMTLPYGSKAFGFRAQIANDTIAPMGREAPWENPWEAAGYLADATWEAVGEVVVAARAAMGWLQEVAKIVAKAGHPIYWTTPTGFVVHQEYQKDATRQIDLTFGGRTIRPSIHDDRKKPKLDRRKQVSAVSPNFVHSLDAAHLTLTVCDCYARGIRSFSMIHDSYGTHAANASIMAQSLRETFVQMYLERDILEEFRAEVQRQLPPGTELPPVPPRGALDIREVLRSPYFFA